YDPFLVLRVDPDTGVADAVHSSTPRFRAADFRGATPPVPAPDRDGRFVALVNEVTRRDGGDVQTHRWIEIDAESGLIAYSRPFVFDRPGLENATGLCVAGAGVLVTYESTDRQPHWTTFDWAAVRQSLREQEPSYL